MEFKIGFTFNDRSHREESRAMMAELLGKEIVWHTQGLDSFLVFPKGDQLETVMEAIRQLAKTFPLIGEEVISGLTIKSGNFDTSGIKGFVKFCQLIPSPIINLSAASTGWITCSNSLSRYEEGNVCIEIAGSTAGKIILRKRGQAISITFKTSKLERMVFLSVDKLQPLLNAAMYNVFYHRPVPMTICVDSARIITAGIGLVLNPQPDREHFNVDLNLQLPGNPIVVPTNRQSLEIAFELLAQMESGNVPKVEDPYFHYFPRILILRENDIWYIKLEIGTYKIPSRLMFDSQDKAEAWARQSGLEYVVQSA